MTRFVHSRWMLLIAGLVMVLAAVGALPAMAPTDYITGDRGTMFPSANLWVTGNAGAELCLNVILTMGLAALMVVLNNTFNLLRTTTLLDATLFVCMAISMPLLLIQFYTGTVLCLTVLACLFLLYSCYGNPRCERRIFLIFTILSAMTMTQYCFVAYIVVFGVGCAQMRVLTPRVVVAALLGLLTPWWIILGCDIMSASAVHFPSLTELLGSIDFTANVPMYVSLVFIVLLLVVGWCLNFSEMIGYNAHMRAYNGTMSVLALVSILALLVDFTNAQAYAPVLAMSAAYQVGRFLVRQHANKRGFIPVLILFVIFAALYLWNVIN